MTIGNDDDLEKLRAAGRLVARTLTAMGAAVTVIESDGAPVLVHVTPDGTTRTELPALAGVAAEGLYLAPVAHSTWGLITEWATERSWHARR